jgi:hypothetical protein
VSSPRPEAIKFVWTLADKVTTCAALANDGTLYEFYLDAVPTAGVILGAPKVRDLCVVAFFFFFNENGLL